jgi:hypothetical protein
MKKILLLLIVLCLSTSCSQYSTSEDALVTEKSEFKINQMLNEKDVERQKLKYALLSSEEKYTIWLNKYESLINDGTSLKHKGIILNDKQKELIEELKNKLTQNVFDKNDNNEKEYFRNIYVPNFLKRAKKVFTYDQIGSLFYKLSESTTDISHEKQSASARVASGWVRDCNCDKGAFFSCQWGGDKCDGQASCTQTFSGCGFNWMWACNGLCRAVS